MAKSKGYIKDKYEEGKYILSVQMTKAEIMAMKGMDAKEIVVFAPDTITEKETVSCKGEKGLSRYLGIPKKLRKDDFTPESRALAMRYDSYPYTYILYKIRMPEHMRPEVIEKDKSRFMLLPRVNRMKIIHLKRKEKYYCKPEVNPNPKKMSRFIRKVTCKNCLDMVEKKVVK